MKNRVKKQALSFAAVMAMILGGGMQLYAADKIADTVVEVKPKAGQY